MSIKIPKKYYPLFQQAGEEKILPKHTVVFSQGDTATKLYLLTKGRVRAYFLSPSGQSTTLEILEAGRIFGDTAFLGRALCPVYTETLRESHLILCSAEDALPLFCAHEELMLLLLQHMTEATNRLVHQIDRLIHYTSEQRLADFLLQESETTENELSFTHDNLAECLGLNRVTVSHIMKKFADQGLLENGYGKIRLKNKQGLAQLLPYPSIGTNRG